jgi:hypothetical protein
LLEHGADLSVMMLLGSPGLVRKRGSALGRYRSILQLYAAFNWRTAPPRSEVLVSNPADLPLRSSPLPPQGVKVNFREKRFDI